MPGRAGTPRSAVLPRVGRATGTLLEDQLAKVVGAVSLGLSLHPIGVTLSFRPRHGG